MTWEVWCQRGSGVEREPCPTYEAAIGLACTRLWADTPAYSIEGPNGFRMDRIAIMRECLERARPQP
jgi:hypothetical protein